MVEAKEMTVVEKWASEGEENSINTLLSIGDVTLTLWAKGVMALCREDVYLN